MKQAAITGIITALVSILCFFGLASFKEKSELSNTIIDPPDLALALKKNRESINSLSLKIVNIQQQLTQDGNRIKTSIYRDGDVEYENLSDRVDEIEATVAKILVSGNEPVEKDSSVIEKQFSERSRRANEISQGGQMQNVIAERDFEIDSGKPLGDFSNSIGEALHSVEGLDVSGMVCRDTICKVSYFQEELLDSQENTDISSDLVDKLSEAAIGSAVEVSYANDSSGRRTMYIQLR